MEEKFRRVRTLFFDYDGCLHDSARLYRPAFQKAYDRLVDRGIARPRQWEEKEVARWLGMSCREMWASFLPDLDPSVRDECMDIIKEEQKALTGAGKAVLYPGALETLAYLKGRGYRLVFLSNCRKYYRDSHALAFGLDDYFDELACSEAYGGIPKHEMLRRIMDKYPPEMAIVGDRRHDMEAGRKNGVHTIGCAYGFAQPGELDGADRMIGDVRELMEIF